MSVTLAKAHTRANSNAEKTNVALFRVERIRSPVAQWIEHSAQCKCEIAPGSIVYWKVIVSKQIG